MATKIRPHVEQHATDDDFDPDSDLPFGLQQDALFGAISTAGAIVLQLAVIAAIAVVLQVDFYLDGWTTLASSIHLVYTTGIAVLATTVTAITAGAFRKLWFRRVMSASSLSLARKDRRARVITGLGSFGDQVRAWQASLAFIVVSLVTAAIVAGFTPRIVATVSPSTTALLLTDPGDFCINGVARRSTAGSWFFWTLPDGSAVGLDQNMTQWRGYCNPRMAVDHLVTGIADGLPSDAAYTIGDILVLQSATGLPLGTNGLDQIFGTHRNADFQWATRCLPVLERNPVRCTQAGSVTYSDQNNTLSVTNGNCSITSESLRVAPSNASAAVLGACSDGHALGQATVLIGAVDEVVGLEGTSVQTADDGYAQQLKSTMNETAQYGRVYAVTCSIDIAAAIGLRMLNYSRSDRLGQENLSNASRITLFPSQSGFGYQVAAVSDDPCTLLADDGTTEISLSEVLGPKILANGAGAVWPLLAENMHDDGWFDTLRFLSSQAGSYHNEVDAPGSGIFVDSQNTLEDAFGGVAAVAMGLMWADLPGAANAQTASLASSSNAYVKVRLGPSNALGYLYILPSLAALALLIWLSWGAWQLRRRVSGLGRQKVRFGHR